MKNVITFKLVTIIIKKCCVLNSKLLHMFLDVSYKLTFTGLFHPNN